MENTVYTDSIDREAISEINETYEEVQGYDIQFWGTQRLGADAQPIGNATYFASVTDLNTGSIIRFSDDNLTDLNQTVQAKIQQLIAEHGAEKSDENEEQVNS